MERVKNLSDFIKCQNENKNVNFYNIKNSFRFYRIQLRLPFDRQNTWRIILNDKVWCLADNFER